jgi:hypothetical protein
MPLLRLLSEIFFIRRLFRGRQARRRGYGGYGGGYGRQRGRGGFFGPFPYYSRRTRGGGQVSVSGCCLPLALGLFAAPIVALRQLVRLAR